MQVFWRCLKCHPEETAEDRQARVVCVPGSADGWELDAANAHLSSLCQGVHVLGAVGVRGAGMEEGLGAEVGEWKEAGLLTKSTCPVCNQGFASAASMERHKSAVHGEVKAFQCEVCHKRFSQAGTLKEHRMAHTDKKRWACWCGKAYAERKTLEVHEKMKHEGGGKRFSCHMCEKEFGTRGALNNHEKGVHGRGRHVCDQCDEAFKQGVDLRKHMLNVHKGTSVTRAHVANWERILGIDPDSDDDDHEDNICENVIDIGENNVEDPDEVQNKYVDTKVVASEEPSKSGDYSDGSFDHGDGSGDGYSIDGHSSPRKCDLNQSEDETKLENTEDGKEPKEEAPSSDESESRPSSPLNCPLFLSEVNEDGLFPCEQCDFLFSLKEELRNHKLEEHEGLRFECGKCEALFLSQPEMQFHKESCLVASKKRGPKAKDGGGLVCGSCGFTATRADRLREHERAEHENIRHTCTQCDKTFAHERNLKAHMKQAHEREPLMCDSCDYSTTRKDSLLQHQRSKHDGVELHCDQCSSTYHQKKDLVRHQKAVHSGSRFTCHLCGFTSNLEAHVKSHVLRQHEGEKFYCHICDKSYCSLKDLVKHEATTHSESPVQSQRAHCTLCGGSYASKKELKHHIEAKHSDLKFPCELCGFEAPSRRLLWKHKRVKHEGKETKGTFLCDECDHVTGYKSALKTHKQAKHSGVKVSCGLCGHQASSDASLRVHIRTKHGETS